MYLMAIVCDRAPSGRLYCVIFLSTLVFSSPVSSVAPCIVNACGRRSCSVILVSCSPQDKLDPRKDADATLAVIIGVASSKHLNCRQMKTLVQRGRVSALIIVTLMIERAPHAPALAYIRWLPLLLHDRLSPPPLRSRSGSI